MPGAPTPPWRSHRPLDPRQAFAALASRGAIAPDRVPREVGRGWDNAVFDAGDRWVRISLRPVSDPLMAREVALLPWLAGRLPLRTPVVLDHGPPLPGVPGPWMTYQPVPGRELASALATGGRCADPSALGRALRALHDPAHVEPWAHRLPRDPGARGRPADLAQRTLGVLDAAIHRRLPVPEHAIRRALTRAATADPGPVRLVHGDLHLRHVVLDSADRPTGWIDWGDTCLAPTSVDLGILWAGIAPPDRALALSTYGGVSTSVEDAARGMALFSLLMLLVAAHDLGDPTVQAATQRALRHAVQ